MSDKPVIFISYSHKDRSELEYVRSHFGSLTGLGLVTIWDDNKLQIGDDWKGDINSAIDACKIFILLVSRHSLGSNFIRETEVPRILPRWKAKQARFCPIVVTPCHMGGFWWLDDPNRRPKERKALSELPEAERDREMATIVGQIETQIRSFGDFPVPAGTATPVRPAALADRVIDYSHLPETPYKNLVGRDDELTELDEAWFDKQTNLVSLIAWGGAGKTSLVNEWLVRLQQAGYRDADAVLGWSFYSQGTKERATSADIFLDWALDRLGIAGVAASAAAKGEALAGALAYRRILLVLDGIEPLQHGPGEQEGLLEDPGLRSLLRGFAMATPYAAHGLLVTTSRLEIRDIEKFRRSDTRPGPSHVIDLSKLSDEAGAALLKDNGVKGTEKQLREAAHEFEGHALALSLLASFIARRFKGDIRQRDRIGPLMQRADMRGHGHARRVMQAYEDEWLKDEPVLSAIMQMVGLFDRPASVGCIDALRRKPVLEGLTEQIVNLSSDEWSDAIAALRDVRLLDPEDLSAPGTLDAHPLVREWFGERLSKRHENAWREGHGRVYEHLRDDTKEGDQPTLKDLAPLYQAVAHGAQAGRHQEALEQVYQYRICRRLPNGELAYYAGRRLGARSSNLAAMSWFFDRPFEILVSALTDTQQSWVLSQAAINLRALGRFAEALPAERSGLHMDEAAKNWVGAAISSANLSIIELLVGELDAAVASGAASIEYADRSGDTRQMVLRFATYADAMHAAGRCQEAESLFAEAERRQAKWQPQYPLLYSLRGYKYCDLLLSKGNWVVTKERAQTVLEWEPQDAPLLDKALVRLLLGRASLGLALTSSGSASTYSNASEDVRAGSISDDEAVHFLRDAGRLDRLPDGLLARTAFRRSIGDWTGAVRDLDEVEEIAEPGPMRLFLCDMALERARLAFAQIEAFAPLNGMLEKDNPPKPEVPSAEEIVKLKEEAEKQIKIAGDYIQTCGYHRRDEELAELQAVLKGEKTFASLPPRV